MTIALGPKAGRPIPPDLVSMEYLSGRANSDPGTGCLIWTGHTVNGYGRFRAARRDWSAHRVAYTVAVGPIPEGYVIDHLCRRPACIRPSHLQAVPLRINTARGEAWNAASVATFPDGFCQRGHELTVVGIYVDKRGDRECRACMNRRSREYHHANRDRILARQRARADRIGGAT